MMAECRIFCIKLWPPKQNRIFQKIRLRPNHTASGRRIQLYASAIYVTLRSRPAKNKWRNTFFFYDAVKFFLSLEIVIIFFWKSFSVSHFKWTFSKKLLKSYYSVMRVLQEWITSIQPSKNLFMKERNPSNAKFVLTVARKSKIYLFSI